MSVLGIHCCAGFSLVAATSGYSLVAVCGLLIVVACLVVEHSSRSTGFSSCSRQAQWLQLVGSRALAQYL